MSADSNTAFERQSRGPLHRRLAPGVPATGDVRRGDVLHQGGFVRRVLELAHVAVEIDCYVRLLGTPLWMSENSHCSCSRRSASASSSVTSSKATSSRGRNWPRRQKSAEITLTGFG